MLAVIIRRVTCRTVCPVPAWSCCISSEHRFIVIRTIDWMHINILGTIRPFVKNLSEIFIFLQDLPFCFRTDGTKQIPGSIIPSPIYWMWGSRADLFVSYSKIIRIFLRCDVNTVSCWKVVEWAEAVVQLTARMILTLEVRSSNPVTCVFTSMHFKK